MTSFSMGFAQAEAVLADMNGIASDKRTAFQARLKNFQRLGLLQDVQEGRGRAATYEAHHLLLLSLAVEFAQLGFPPETSVTILKRSLGRIVAAVKSVPQDEKQATDWSPQIVYFDPANLAPLMARPSADDPRFGFYFAPVEIFKERLRDMLADGHTRLALINITGLIVRIAEALDQVSELKALRASRFYAQALYDWAASVDATESEEMTK